MKTACLRGQAVFLYGINSPYLILPAKFRSLFCHCLDQYSRQLAYIYLKTCQLLYAKAVYPIGFYLRRVVLV